MYNSEKAWNDLISWIPEKIVITPDICYVCGEEIAPDLTAIYSTGFGLWRHTNCDRTAMFFALKDEHGRYIHRAATFSGGYDAVYTNHLKLARLWDESGPPEKVVKNYNKYLDKLEAAGTLQDCHAYLRDDIGWNWVNTQPSKIHLIEVSLSEIS